ncbi:MAG TPA: hypothetical protein VM639_24320 [Dongiaceae bacterium]|nr:hypothetical protein [Dongiaceae bacterium]
MFKNILLGAAMAMGSFLRLPATHPHHDDGRHREIPASRVRRHSRRSKQALNQKPVFLRDEWTIMVARLTNWQRNQWARAGYPGLVKRDVTKLRLYADMSRR